MRAENFRLRLSDSGTQIFDFNFCLSKAIRNHTRKKARANNTDDDDATSTRRKSSANVEDGVGHRPSSAEARTTGAIDNSIFATLNKSFLEDDGDEEEPEERKERLDKEKEDEEEEENLKDTGEGRGNAQISQASWERTQYVQYSEPMTIALTTEGPSLSRHDSLKEAAPTTAVEEVEVDFNQIAMPPSQKEKKVRIRVTVFPKRFWSQYPVGRTFSSIGYTSELLASCGSIALAGSRRGVQFVESGGIQTGYVAQ